MHSFTEAILSLFDELNNHLAAAGLPDGAVRAYLFGGCAVHMYAHYRMSEDVDAEFDYNLLHRNCVLWAINQVHSIDFNHPVLGPLLLAFDPYFNTTLGPLHVDYQDRATQLPSRSAASPLTIWLPGAMDIAISKLGRLSTVDVEDILVLLQDPSASWHAFEVLAKEAAQYYVGRDLGGTIAYVKLQWLRRNPHDSCFEEAE
jgi:hypothetical protein